MERSGSPPVDRGSGTALAGEGAVQPSLTTEEAGNMARYRRRTRTRRSYGWRRGRSGIDPLFWVALGVAALIALFVVAR